MRQTTYTAALCIALLASLLIAWGLGLFWLLADISVTDYPIFLSLLLGLVVASTLIVVLGSQWWIKQLFQPRVVDDYTNGAYSQVARILQQRAALLNIRQPVLHIYDSSSLNAFIVGGIWRQQHLYLSEALVTRLSRDEIDAVIAHELAHIYHKDVVVNEVFFGMGAACMYLLQHTLGKAVAFFVNKEDPVELGKTIAVVMTYGGLLLPLWLLMLLYSRHSEYRADALASQLVGNQQFLWLLHRLRGVCRDSFFNLNALQLLLRHYFTTHPPLHLRINALEARQQA